MIKFSIKVFLFLVFGYIIGEIVVRAYRLNIDIPNFYKDTDGLIKNKPNQTGYYVNGNKWFINKYGHYGYEPKSLDNLITVIGDSYIENIMNPPECHQAYFLARMVDEYNYYPCARSGASFIEFMEMSKSLNHLNPIKQLLYVHHGDFIESITEITNNPLTVQLSITTNKIRYARLTKSRFKDILYNLKFAYFLYRNYIVKNTNVSSNNRDIKHSNIDFHKIQMLLNFVKKNYFTDNIILVFSPDTDNELIELIKENNFQTIELKSTNYKSWQLINDGHWSCYGHEEAAMQVSKCLVQDECIGKAHIP
jgi:hypothetical protein